MPQVASASYVSKVMKRVYLKMFLAMIVTALTSFVCLNVPAVLYTLVANSGLYFGLLIAEVILVFVLAGALHKISSPVATILFYVYSILNGVVLSAIEDIPKSFVVCDHPYHRQIVYISQLNSSTLARRSAGGKEGAEGEEKCLNWKK